MSGILSSIAGATYAAAARTAKTVTAAGNAQIDTAQSKFGGASALFDGTGDRLDITSSSDLAFGTGDFTIECFVRFVSRSGNQTFIDFRPGAGGFHVVAGHIGGAPFLFINGSNVIYNDTSFNANNVFFHWALVRSSATTKIYVDGNQITGSYSDTNNYTATAPSIGEVNSAFGLTGFGINGHIDEFRISKIARYTTTFTPSTTPFTFDSNTLLLLHCNGTDATTVFTDDVGTNAIPRTPNTITAVGNAQVATAQSKFGGASMLSDGAGDCLQVSSNADFGYGTGDFTIEFFIRPTTNLTGTYNIWDQRDTGAGGGLRPSIYISGGVLYYYTNSDNRISYSINLLSGTWYHIAVSRLGTSTKMFLDGTQVGSTYTDSNSYTTSQVVIGAYAASGSYTGSTPAYFDEIRISNSARYTTTFTPSASAFTNDRNTLLLIHANGVDASTTFTDDNA